MTASSRCVLDPLSCYYIPNTRKGRQHRFCSRRSPAGGCVHRCHPIHTAPLVAQGFFRFPSRRASCSRAEGPIPWFPGGHGAHTYGKKVCAGSGTNAGMCCTRSLVSPASLCIHGPFPAICQCRCANQYTRSRDNPSSFPEPQQTRQLPATILD